MRAVDPEVVDAVWSAIERLIPAVPEVHPLGCHRPRVADRVCFEGILVSLVTGCSWVDVECLLGDRVSDTTLRARRDEWIAAGVFDRLADDAIASYDRIIGLDFSDCSIDGSLLAPRLPTGTAPSCRSTCRCTGMSASLGARVLSATELPLWATALRVARCVQ